MWCTTGRTNEHCTVYICIEIYAHKNIGSHMLNRINFFFYLNQGIIFLQYDNEQMITNLEKEKRGKNKSTVEWYQ